MQDEESYIVKYRELATIVRAADATALEQFLDQPMQAIAEAVTGLLASRPQMLAVVAGRVVQGALKGKLFQQVSREINALRDAGKINPNFAEEKIGYQSWVELMGVIDSEIPDEDKLEALKAMFFSVNKVTASDSEKVVAYQLFQIAKRLSSADLMVLKATYDLYRDAPNALMQGNHSHNVWTDKVSKKLGHSLVGLVGLGERALVDNSLLTAVHSTGWIDGTNSRLTDLGIRFCQNIQNYQLEVATTAQE